MLQTIHHRLHILEAADWKAGIITLLAPASPYRPWRYAFGEARPGDYALVVLGTDPQSVLTVLGRFDDEATIGGALLDVTRRHADLLELATLASTLDLGNEAFTAWRLDDDVAERVILAVHETPLWGDPYHRYGHSSLAAARNLLLFNGHCEICGKTVDLAAADAVDAVHVHTADVSRRSDPPSPIRSSDEDDSLTGGFAQLRATAEDWPTVMCGECRDDMRSGGFTSSLHFALSRHPRCPRCDAQRSRAILYGMPANPESWAPWLAMGGCCLGPEKWTCEICGHQW